MTFTKGRFARGERRWISRATTSLPTPLSPLISTVTSVAGDLLDHRAHAAHRLAMPGDRPRALFQLFEQPRALLLQLARLEHDAQRRLQLLFLEGLVEVVRRAELHGLHDRAGATDDREDHDRQARPALVHAAQRLEPVHAGHHHVHQHDVGIGARVEQRHRAATVLGGVHLEAAQLEQIREIGADALGVVDHEDAARALGRKRIGPLPGGTLGRHHAPRVEQAASLPASGTRSALPPSARAST